MSDIPNDALPVELQDEAYEAFSEAFQQRAPAPRSAMRGDADPAPVPDDSAPPESTPAEPVPDAAPPADTTPPAAPDAQPPPPASGPLTFGGREYDQATVEQYLNIVNRLAALPQDQRAAIDHLISTGQFPTPSSAPPPVGSTPEAPQDEYLDPRAAADIKALREQLTTLQQSQANLTQTATQSEQERLNTIVTGAINEFATSHTLSFEDANKLATEAARLQIGPALLEQHRGDYHASTLEAMEVAMYRLPEFREKAIADRVKSEVDKALADQTTRDTKKARAGALAGSPTGSVPRDTPAPRPTNRQEQIDAIASVIREAQSNGVPS